MAQARLIYVLGAPSSGTSAVAGVLHHLGVDMGPEFNSARPYQTFEDKNVLKYAKPAPAEDVSRLIMSKQRETWRDFRQYCEDRLARARGPAGVKIGPTVWLADPDPSSLPLAIVRVLRPLEDSIRSNWNYGQEQGQDKIRRAMEVAGYWACCEALCEYIKPTVTLDFYRLLQEPALSVAQIAGLLGLRPDRDQLAAARVFINPSMRHV